MNTFSLDTAIGVSLTPNGLVYGPIDPTDYIYKPVWIAIRTLFACICRSDLKEMANQRYKLQTFGHEIVGTVEKVSGTTEFQVGDIVTLNPNVKLHRTSGFSTIIYASASGHQTFTKAFIKIKSKDNLKRMIFIEPLSCAFHCFSGIKKLIAKLNLNIVSKSVAVIGAGFFGSLIALLFLESGYEVTVYNRSETKLEYLEKKKILPKAKLSLLSCVVEKSADIVVIATSMLEADVLKVSSKIVKNDGLINLFGGTYPRMTFPETSFNIDLLRRKNKHLYVDTLNRNFFLSGSHGATKEDFQTAIRILRNEHSLNKIEHFISRRIKLSDLLETMKIISRTGYVGKLLVEFPESIKESEK